MTFETTQEILELFGDCFQFEYSYDSNDWYIVKDLKHLKSLRYPKLITTRYYTV